MADQEVDLSHIHWTSPEWIYHLPTKSLSTPDEALDYFAISPFWDVKSNNHALRTQRRVFDPFYGAAQERQDLLSFRGGFEYVVSHSRAPDLYLIQRREVQSDGSRKDTDGMFFILHGKVYSAPSLFDILDTRLRNANHLLVECFALLSDSRPPANPRTPASWRSLPPITSMSKQITSNRPTAPPTPSARQDSIDPSPAVKADAVAEPTDAQMDYLLYNALQASRAKIADLETLAGRPREEVSRPPDRSVKDIDSVSGGGGEAILGREGTSGALAPTPGMTTQRLGLAQSSSGRTPSVLGIDPVSSPMSFT